MGWYLKLKAAIAAKYGAEVNAALSAAILFYAYQAGEVTKAQALYYFFLSIAVGGIGGVLRVIVQTQAAKIAANPNLSSEMPGLPATMAASVAKIEKDNA